MIWIHDWTFELPLVRSADIWQLLSITYFDITFFCMMMNADLCFFFYFEIKMCPCSCRSTSISSVTLHSATETSSRATFFWTKTLLPRFAPVTCWQPLALWHLGCDSCWKFSPRSCIFRLLISALRTHRELVLSALKLSTQIYAELQVWISPVDLNCLEVTLCLPLWIAEGHWVSKWSKYYQT